ncbi:interferon-inducible GTPase 5-like isoform X1 [Alosa alosa]|uniref:interferon-inducible GTPase 5-like isoform X1 n=1 Tax=Alosa alosa TaxID=278164 RepID=UPI0020150BCB|nr:interferon-inducible GTPase 5-like isoform X1 [Alosa alosa]XP_048117775.1 interferon-inducible GTPase 5-like isoform X1 [Alosa alosa]XP_048117776.1 interferon-inducible GTPase 5-like isoform X1 [Alosa alosa]XP_048117777.1 interferon-inducible GTPase 5-like isoform X1 [Alosa alosa]
MSGDLNAEPESDILDIYGDGGAEGLSDDKEAQTLVEEFKNFSSDAAVKKVKEDIDTLDHVTLNIGVTGNTGAGKSSFVNAIRGLSNDDEGAADTGVTETTMTPTPYPHPTMPNVTIWDLPGIGTPNFKAKMYLSDVHFERYDFFIILTSERFKENDINLAKAIKQKKRLFYFIRSKIDNDINAENRRRDFNEERLLDKIREDCKKNLSSVGKPQVFLVSSFNLNDYDFNRFMDSLEKELPEKKKHALILSLPVYSLEALDRKKKHLQKMIWLTAFGSGAIAVVAIPGLTVPCDYGIIMSFLESVFRSFGLEDTSLQRLATRVRLNWKDLKAEIKSRFKDGVTTDAVTSLLATPSMASIMTLKGLMSGIIPFMQLPAGAISVAVIHYLLNKGLNEMENDAKSVLEKARLHQV